jgi:hypothetical protein
MNSETSICWEYTTSWCWLVWKAGTTTVYGPLWGHPTGHCINALQHYYRQITTGKREFRKHIWIQVEPPASHTPNSFLFQKGGRLALWRQQQWWVTWITKQEQRWLRNTQVFQVCQEQHEERTRSVLFSTSPFSTLDNDIKRPFFGGQLGMHITMSDVYSFWSSSGQSLN